jgi:hypothetical protein
MATMHSVSWPAPPLDPEPSEPPPESASKPVDDGAPRSVRRFMMKAKLQAFVERNDGVLAELAKR